jgi:hypothetical protein
MRKQLIGLAVILMFMTTTLFVGVAEAKKGPQKQTTEFMKGYDFGRAFLKPKSKKGIKYRRGVWMQIMRWLPDLVHYIPYEIVEMGSRAHLESRGRWRSHTKDTTIYEAGLTSIGYDFAKQVCLDWGVCGNPCGDPRLSIALAAYQRFLSRRTVFYETEGTFWDEWLLQQATENQFEAEVLIGICGAVNCQKMRKAIKMADKESKILTKTGKDGNLHVFWNLMSWMRSKEQGTIAFIFAPKTNFYQLGTRFGRVVAMKDMRTEFYKQTEGEPTVYGWEVHDTTIEEPLAYYPHHLEWEDGVATMVPDFPEPLFPTGPKYMKFSEWREGCYMYGSKGWKQHGEDDEPDRNDRWKKTGMNYHPVTEEPINVKKAQKKYASQEEFEAAHDKWTADMQQAGVLPTDEEYEEAWVILEQLGFELVNPVKE